MKQILHSTFASLVIISLFSLVFFLFFSAAFGAITAIVSNVQQSLAQANSFTNHFYHTIN